MYFVLCSVNVINYRNYFWQKNNQKLKLSTVWLIVLQLHLIDLLKAKCYVIINVWTTIVKIRLFDVLLMSINLCINSRSDIDIWYLVAIWLYHKNPWNPRSKYMQRFHTSYEYHHFFNDICSFCPETVLNNSLALWKKCI